MPIAQPKTQFDDVPAWPETKPSLGENPASIGHNEPPLEERIQMEFREALLTDHADFLVRMDEMIASVDRASATDDETLGRCGTLAKMLRAAVSHVESTHKVVKEPYLLGGRAVDAEKNRLVGILSPAQAKLQDKMNAFMAEREAKRRAEEARRAAEQRAAAEAAAKAEREAREAEQAAARAAAEAASDEDREAAERAAAVAADEAQRRMEEAALAAAPVAKAEPVRSDEGATISGTKVWQSQVTDYTLAFIAVEDNPKVREAVDKAVAALVRAGKRSIDGVRIWETVAARTR